MTPLHWIVFYLVCSCLNLLGSSWLLDSSGTFWDFFIVYIYLNLFNSRVMHKFCACYLFRAPPEECWHIPYKAQNDDDLKMKMIEKMTKPIHIIVLCVPLKHISACRSVCTASIKLQCNGLKSHQLWNFHRFHVKIFCRIEVDKSVERVML